MLPSTGSYSGLENERASIHGLACEWDAIPDAAFMVLILAATAMADVSGIARYGTEFSEFV